jgi:hypothetical protein
LKEEQFYGFKLGIKMIVNKLKLSYLLVYLISLLSLNQIYHLERVYDLFFLNIIPSLNFDPLTKTFIIILIYSGVFIIGYILLFSKIGLKISNNKYFTLTLIFLILLFSFTITLEHNKTIDFNSDNDAALDLWLGNILNSTFPYEGVTQLGNSISDLPFLPIYSLPFYLIGNVGWQNIINVIIILLVLWKFTDTKKQLNFALMSLLISVPFFIFLFTQFRPYNSGCISTSSNLFTN